MAQVLHVASSDYVSALLDLFIALHAYVEIQRYNTYIHVHHEFVAMLLINRCVCMYVCTGTLDTRVLYVMYVMTLQHVVVGSRSSEFPVAAAMMSGEFGVFVTVFPRQYLRSK